MFQKQYTENVSVLWKQSRNRACFIINTKNVHVFFKGLKIVSIKHTFFCVACCFFLFFQIFVNFLYTLQKPKQYRNCTCFNKTVQKMLVFLENRTENVCFVICLLFQVQLYFNKQVHFFFVAGCFFYFFKHKFIFFNTLKKWNRTEFVHV